MGDHRIKLSIRAEFHGKVYEIKDAWWNWCGPVDRRVEEFFENMWNDGVSRWRAEIDEADRERRSEEIESEERKELARLQAKFGA